jgi:mono/diheme cytochrome c family protein
MRTFWKVSICMVLCGMAWAGRKSLLEQAPVKYAERKNPFEGDRGADGAGAKLYERECAACHGPNREGRGKAPPLNRPNVSHAAPGALFWVLRNGSLNRGMPSFAHLPEPQRWQIVSFLQAETRP